MDLKTYQSIQSQLNFARRTSMWVRHGLIDLLLLGASLWLLTKASWVPYLAAQAILAVVFFRGFSLMHEAVHQSVSNNPWINTVVGLYGAVLCFMPYHSWKYLHLEHHQWAGNIDRDPSNKLRKDYDPSKRLKYRLLTGIWRSWIPLLGLMQEGVFWVYPFKQLKNPTYRPAIKQAIVFSMVVPVVVYVGLAWTLPALFCVSHFAPAFFLYLMMVEGINFPHHMDVPAYRGTRRLSILDQHEISRSSSYPMWAARFFLLNFNLHTEHHLFPRLPWYQLDKARELVKAALKERYNESQGNAWIRKNRSRDLEELLPLPEDVSLPERKAA